MLYIIMFIAGVLSATAVALPVGLSRGARRERLTQQRMADDFDGLTIPAALELLDKAETGYGERRWSTTVTDPITQNRITLTASSALQLARGVYGHRRASQLFEEVRRHLPA